MFENVTYSTNVFFAFKDGFYSAENPDEKRGAWLGPIFILTHQPDHEMMKELKRDYGVIVAQILEVS